MRHKEERFKTKKKTERISHEEKKRCKKQKKEKGEKN